MDIHKLESDAIDNAREFLTRPVIREQGATAAQIASEFGIAIGYMNQLLKKNEQGFRKKGFRWFVDDSGLADWETWSNRADHWSKRTNPNLAPRFVRNANGDLHRIAYDGSIVVVPRVFSGNESQRIKRKVS